MSFPSFLRGFRAAGIGLCATAQTVAVAAAVSLSTVLWMSAPAVAAPPDRPASGNQMSEQAGGRPDTGHIVAPAQAGQLILSDRILLKGKPGVSNARLQGIVDAQGGREVGRIARIDVREIKVPAHARDVVVRALQKNPAIKFAEPVYLVGPDYVAPDDPGYGDAWHLPTVDAPTAWSLSKGDGIVVAVLDTGVDSSHPDLAAKLVPGWNAASQSDDISDVHGHGTWVSGTVGAATDNSTGVAALGWNTMIMPIKVTNRSDGWASTTDIARGLVWAADNGAHIANMSYMVWQFSTVQTAAAYMRDNGGLVFGSAGNNGADGGYSPTPHIIVVGATARDDIVASWSNFGAYIDLSAPGVAIETTHTDGRYTAVSGTSFSSPVAAGVASLVMGANGQLNAAQVEKILFDSAEDLGETGWDAHYGWGRVNAGNAVTVAWSELEDRVAPEVRISAPADGTTVDGEVTIRVDATDDVGVVEVLIHVDGQLLGTEVVAPFEFLWDTAAGAEGSVQLMAEARDATGNISRDEIQVNVRRTVVEPDPDPEPEPALSLSGTNANHGRTWTAIVTLTGPEGATTAGAWDQFGSGANGCTIESGKNNCSFSLEGIRRNVHTVTYVDEIQDRSVTIGMTAGHHGGRQ